MFEYGQALAKVMDEKEISQVEAGRMLNVSNSHVCKMINGKRKPPKDVMRAAAIKLDDPRLHFATIHEITGGAFPAWLNNVNLDPGTVAFKTVEELHEAERAIRTAPLHKRTESFTPEDQKQLDLLMEEVREMVCAGLMLMGVICITHGRSWAAEWKGHNLQMEVKNYLVRK